MFRIKSFEYTSFIFVTGDYGKADEKVLCLRISNLCQCLQFEYINLAMSAVLMKNIL